MIGTTVSHYRLLHQLGSGGMGVVYKAHDTKLDRWVALKFVSEAISRDPAALQRFEREARTASALNHPGICTVYEIDSADGRAFIAMEFIDGLNLRDRLAVGPLPLGLLLVLALEIADALHSAHMKGICHRDIKPANIIITLEERAKLLDFGLAKVDAQRPEQANVQTVAAMLTSPGTVMGTSGYMSPEQALGRPADHRSDLFSFGMVLYEMATGRHALASTTTTLLDAILHEQPPAASSIVPELPPQFDLIIEKALEKDPEVRYQTIADLRTDLRRLKRSIDSPDAPASSTAIRTRPAAAERRPPSWRTASLTAGVVIVCGLLAYLVVAKRPAGPARSLLLTDARFVQLTDEPGVEANPHLSPDGKSIVYSGGMTGNRDIYLQRVEGKTAINLTADSAADDTGPTFSPDGTRIAFRSERDGGGIFVMGATGESVKRVSDAGYDPAWSPDGRFIVYATEPVDIPTIRWSNSALWVIDVETGQKRELTKGDAVHPHWSPHGTRIAYWGMDSAARRNIQTVPVGGGPPTAVTDSAFLDWNPVWSPDGQHLLFSSNRGGALNLWRVRIDERSGKALAAPEPLTTPSANSGFISVSTDGSAIAYLQQTLARNIMRVSFDPAALTLPAPPVAVTRGTHYLRNPDISPDGTSLAFSQDDKLMVVRADGTGLRQLTEGTFHDRAPRWSPDGQRLAFYSPRSDTMQLWAINVDGSSVRQLTSVPATDGLYYPVWSPDGRSISSASLEGKSYLVDVANPMAGNLPTLPPLPGGSAAFVPWTWSQDGKQLAGWRQHQDGTASGVIIYDPQSKAFTAVTSFGNYPAWLDRGRLLFSGRKHLNVVEIASGRVRNLPTPAAFDEEFALSPDRRTIYYTENQREGDVWLIKLPAAGKPAS